MPTLQPLPESKNDIFDHGDKYMIDIKDIRDGFCKEHNFDIYNAKREVKCSVCGYSARFTPSTIRLSEDQKEVFIREVKHKIDHIY